MAFGLSAFGAKKRRGGSLGDFSFPSPASVVPPSTMEDDLLRQVKLANLICGLLVGSLVVTVVLAARLVQVANVEPYVADGGVFGCRVPSIEEIQP